ncbi:amidohydrolase [Microbulbifer sp. YPW1]|uniref:amidohydrolase n=1 Tax=Microbulbifer sp. YPW1 TaxID=2745199 RepID=UPI00159A6382|nr:amidohydrolase [Microbulbifer sp. YPW1]QKX16521.1 amidohydrolase [Microbulbifer sp. YPW1]
MDIKKYLRVALLLSATLLIAGCDEEKSAARIFINGTIVTADKNHPLAEAIAVRDGRIIAVGTRAEVEKFSDDNTEVTDLSGNTLLPGFVAAHEHPAISAVFRNFFDMSGFTHPSAADAWKALEAEIANTPRGEWIYAKGLDPVLLSGLATPTRTQLDQLAPHNPVFILAQSMHTAWVNSAALAAMGIDENSPVPGEGSYYGRDENGRLNGMLVEKPALEPFLAPHKNPLKVTAAYQAELDDLRRAGYTTVASLGFNVPAWLARWVASDHFSPRIRQFFYYRGENLDKLDGTPEKEGDSFRVLGAKFWYDGSPYSGSMVVEQAYADSDLSTQLGIAHGSHGEPVIGAQEFQQQLHLFSERGWQTATHVQGDRAARDYLRLLQANLDNLPVDQRDRFIAQRHRLEHGLLLSESLLPQLAELGITPSFHINHLYYYGDALKDQLLGEERAQRLLPVAAAFAHDMHPTLHADSPMFPAEPFSLMQTAITRRSRGGTVLGPDQALTPLQALRALTINGAWQLGMENEVGSIEVGKYADLVIVDKNPLTTPAEQWREIRVLQTLIAGRD